MIIMQAELIKKNLKNFKKRINKTFNSKVYILFIKCVTYSANKNAIKLSNDCWCDKLVTLRVKT